MKTRILFLTMIGMILLVLIISCAKSTPLPATEAIDPETLITDKCSSCHSTSLVFSADYNEEGWSNTIDDMIEKGAKVTDEEKQIMIDWLLSGN